MSLGTVAATDQEGAALSYSIEGGNAAGLFEIDAASGELFYTVAGEDFEAGTGPFELTVRASDGDFSMDTAVTVSVTDVQEAPKSVSEPDGEDFAAWKSTDGRVAVGDSVTGNITQHDKDWFAVKLEAGGEYRFDLKGSPTGDGTLEDPFLTGIYNKKGIPLPGTSDGDGGADYVLAVKDNQGQLHDDVRDLFLGAEEFGFAGVPHDFAATLEKGHGRIERRECWVIADPESLEYRSAGQEWPKLRSAVKVAGRREGVQVQPRYYISSLEASAQRLLEAVRSHWSIENSLHWTRDVTFGEDQCRVRKDHAPQNMALLRQISHNLLKNETSLKVGIQGKRLQAGWREDYLLKVLLG